MKRYFVFYLIFVAGLLSMVSDTALKSSVYDWETLPVKKNSSGSTRSFFNSPTRSLQSFYIDAISLNQGKSTREYKVAEGSDELIIIKEGSLDIKVNQELRSLTEGSLVVASGGDKISISNNQKSSATYFSIRFNPIKKENSGSGAEEIAPLFIDWNKVPFVPSQKGGRRGIMREKRSALKELEIHVTTLKEGLPSHAAHVHADEEIILVKKGKVEEIINEKPYKLGTGSVIFLTDDDPHGISNAGSGECEYYAIRWLVE